MGMPKTRGCPYHCDTASHFCPVRVRILWLLPAVNCLSLPFTYRTLCGHASLFPPSLPCPFHFQLTQARFHFSVSYSVSVKGTVANSMLFTLLYLHPGRGRGVFLISSDWDDRMRAKIKTQKNPLGFQQNQKKIPGLKINPQKISCTISGP